MAYYDINKQRQVNQIRFRMIAANRTGNEEIYRICKDFLQVIKGA